MQLLLKLIAGGATFGISLYNKQFLYLAKSLLQPYGEIWATSVWRKFKSSHTKEFQYPKDPGIDVKIASHLPWSGQIKVLTWNQVHQVGSPRPSHNHMCSGVRLVWNVVLVLHQMELDRCLPKILLLSQNIMEYHPQIFAVAKMFVTYKTSFFVCFIFLIIPTQMCCSSII